MLKPYKPNQSVTVTTEVTEAFDKWSSEPENRSYLNNFWTKVEEDPHSAVSASLIEPALERMENYGFDPTHFELSDIISAFSASDNWRRFARTRDNEYRLAAALITEANRLTGSKEEYIDAVWGIAMEWSGTTSTTQPVATNQALHELLFDEPWTVLYADLLNTSYLNNLKVIKEANPMLKFKAKPVMDAALPSDDIAP